MFEDVRVGYITVRIDDLVNCIVRRSLEGVEFARRRPWEPSSTRQSAHRVKCTDFLYSLVDSIWLRASKCYQEETSQDTSLNAVGQRTGHFR